MIKVETAKQIINSQEVQVTTEYIQLSEAVGRILAEDIYSSIDSPPFDKSAMDGFAYSSGSTSEKLRIVETIAAGETPSAIIKPGECARIMTGAMIPEGADRVVKVENTTEENGYITFIPEKITNIIHKGENLSQGEKVMGTRILRPQDIGVLASVGINLVPVAKAPLIGIITTGTELKEPGERLEIGQIYNSNGHQLKAQVEAMNCPTRYYGTVPDEEEATARIINQALNECDVVLLSGGVSMGSYDYVPAMLEHNGVDILLHKIAVKPGKPTLFGKKDTTYVFGMPGNPVSTFVIFEVFVKPFLYKMMGWNFVPETRTGILTEDIRRRKTERLEFKPVIYDNGKIQPVRYHGSSHLNVLCNANAIIIIDQGISELNKGTEIDARPL